MTINLHSLPPAQRNAALEAVRRAGRGRRVYRLAATMADGQPVPHAPHAICSPSRIRVVLVTMFGKVFGGRPSFAWAKSGRMGEAWDDHGHRLAVQQINNLPFNRR